MGKWKNKTKLKKGKKIRHIIYAVYYTAYLPLPAYIIRIRDSTTTTTKRGDWPQLSAAI
jgi:hypothetical protein